MIVEIQILHWDKTEEERPDFNAARVIFQRWLNLQGILPTNGDYVYDDDVEGYTVESKQYFKNSVTIWVVKK